MEKDKRGIKHIKDKRKYKRNSSSNNSNNNYGPRKELILGSNLYRYAESENENTHNLNDVVDFSILSTVPISTTCYFTSKNDKRLYEETEQLGTFFCLSLNLLQQCILTVPFYDRMEINKSYFTPSEIEDMNKEVKEHKRKYEKLARAQTQEDKKQTGSLQLVSFENSGCPYLQENPDDITNRLPPEKKTSFKTDTEVIKFSIGDKCEDLEQWLEDILDD